MTTLNQEMVVTKVIKRGPYEIRHAKKRRGKTWYNTKYAYSTYDGSYIGHTKIAYRLVHRYGIRQFEAPNKKIATIGWSPKNKKWYGWSHRALYGFKPGIRSKKGHHPHVARDYIIKDAKKAAIAFAKDVS